MAKHPLPFDLSSESALLNVPGIDPTETDLRGTSTKNTHREWGGLEFDPDLTFGEFEYSFITPSPYVIGENCDLMLVHPDINGGDPVGFVLTPTPTNKGSSFSIQRETTSDGSIHIFMFFTVIMSDDLKDPDGGKHADSRQTMYDWLLEFLTAEDTFAVMTVLGCYVGIGPLGHSATELHLVNGTFINVKLANLTAYHGPVDPEFFLASIWHDAPPPLDALTWESSLWR